MKRRVFRLSSCLVITLTCTNKLVDFYDNLKRKTATSSEFTSSLMTAQENSQLVIQLAEILTIDSIQITWKCSTDTD